MEIFRIRRNAYLEGVKAGFVGGAFVAIATAFFAKKMKQDFDNRYPYSTPK